MRAKVAYQARQLKKAKQIEDTWTWDGRVFIMDTNKKVHSLIRSRDLRRFDKANIIDGDEGHQGPAAAATENDQG